MGAQHEYPGSSLGRTRASATSTEPRPSPGARPAVDVTTLHGELLDARLQANIMMANAARTRMHAASAGDPLPPPRVGVGVDMGSNV